VKPIPYVALAEAAAEFAKLCRQYEDLLAEIQELKMKGFMDSDRLSERLKAMEEKCPNYPSIKMTEILSRIQRPN
jgi:hypothetical protein